jgi:hypothetical protein
MEDHPVYFEQAVSFADDCDSAEHTNTRGLQEDSNAKLGEDQQQQ